MKADIIAQKAIIVGNAMATSGIIADIALFNDKGYLYFALLGSFISVFGVIHELMSNTKNITRRKIVSEILKGFAIGLFAIPFWYLFLTNVGNKLLYILFNIQNEKDLSNTFWFIISFYLSWYSVPIFDWIVERVAFKSKEKL